MAITFKQQMFSIFGIFIVGGPVSFILLKNHLYEKRRAYFKLQREREAQNKKEAN
ncbi:Schizosaccharomyces specific protein [Schizosaccharomyces osmophilus]|uniref:Schizosaccharomyces specific protein n=1 Tax=Schizosaccharomyces osmophilus TaxID=2545709 RepID=A0AAE9W799_9SCHI|nr:Schizosaccharomyces specific protein [Schizosaccharomyces osmophilus]WBW70750.1 Schizosaccharomyces specific protein [Schizosaccharomyces osmophilus]